MKRFLYMVYLGFALCLGDDSALPKLEAERLEISFQRYMVKDSFDRTITCYLSRVGKEQDGKKLPLILFVQGSGCQSLFMKRGDKIAGGIQNLVLKQAGDQARVLVVEKPGVNFLDSPPRPGSAEGGSEEFLREHTLDRWTEANAAAVRGVWKLEGIDPTRTLVMGHSEGGIVAAAVAAKLPEVTHVASLAGGGPTQLFDLVELRKVPRPDESREEQENRVAAAFDDWKKIQADPESITEFWMGHPYRRWSSFLTRSVVEELKKSKTRIYLAQGSEDKAVSPKSYDIAIAELKTQGRDVTGDYIVGGDHGFRTEANPDGFTKVIDRVLQWFGE
jgi:pimeloyl-ACP methyl ester carboxylesterase